MSKNLVLELLRAIRGDIAALSNDVHELKHRMSLVEVSLAAIRRDIAGLYEMQAGSSVRMDTLEDRVQRIERRLDLIGHT